MQPRRCGRWTTQRFDQAKVDLGEVYDVPGALASMCQPPGHEPGVPPASIEEVLAGIETVVSRTTLAAAVVTIDELVPDNGQDEWRALLAARRIGTVSGFLRVLTARIEFGADPEAAPTLTAMKGIPALLDRRSRLTAADIDLEVVTGNWKQLVLAPGGTVDKNATCFAC